MAPLHAAIVTAVSKSALKTVSQVTAVEMNPVAPPAIAAVIFENRDSQNAQVSVATLRMMGSAKNASKIGPITGPRNPPSTRPNKPPDAIVAKSASVQSEQACA